MKAKVFIRPLIRLRSISLLLTVSVLLPISALQAQDGALLAREGDESATTQEERQRVLTTLLATADESRNSGDSLMAARFLNRAGRLQLRLNLPQDALATFQEASSILKQAPDPSVNVDSLNGIGAAYAHLSRCDEAQTVLQKAIALSEQSGYVAGKAEALLTTSDCQNYADHELALKTAQESLALWQSIDQKSGIAKAYAAVGHFQLAQNNLIEATQSHEAALNLWRELNIPDEQAEALINLGFIEYRKGAWQNSLLFMTQAQGLLDEKSEPFKMGQITAGLAEAFIESGMPENGLGKLQQSLEYFRQSENPRSVIVISWDIGKTYYLLGNYPEALVRLKGALADAAAIKDTVVIAMCHESLGRTYAALNDPTTALEHFHTAYDLHIKLGNRMEAARTNALMGQIYQQEGKIERARSYYQTALKTFRALTDHVNESATLYALGSLELEQNNLDTAEGYLQESLDVTENVRRVGTSSDLTAAFSATVHERYEKYIECLMRRQSVHSNQDLAVQAFEFSELARARSLTESLHATETSLASTLDPQLAEREKSLRQTLRAKEDHKVALLGGQYKKDELSTLEAEIARLESEYKKITDTIRQQHPSYEQMTRPTAWNLKQIQEQVIADDQTVLLEYLLGEDESYLWAVTRQGIKSFRLPPQAQIVASAQELYKLLSSPPAEGSQKQFSETANELSRMILAPAATELNKSRVIVVADGVLNFIPFQVLPVDSTNDEPLIASREVINTPSATVLGQLRQEVARRHSTGKLLAAFGDPVFASNYAQRRTSAGGEQLAALSSNGTVNGQQALRDIEISGQSFDPAIIQPLFYARRELSNLHKVADGREAFFASEFTATRDELLRTDLTQFAILHFATHGILDPKRPENSGLVLSTVNTNGAPQNGFVSLRDIYQLRAPVDLVVLSACQTGLGKELRGEGLIGLTRGFMYAGASSVVASLWKVDDEATAELMRRFYVNMLRDGMTPAAALHAAQNSIRQEPQWRSPYYWAAFTLQGEYRENLKVAAKSASNSAWVIPVLGAFFVISLIGALWGYRRLSMKRARPA